MPVEWMTYRQIGERFGLGTEAARTRVRRLGWRTQPDDGRTLVQVPDDADIRPASDRACAPDGDRPVGPGELAALVELLTAAEVRVRRLEQLAETERDRAVHAEAMTAQVKAELAGQTARSDRLQAELEQARAAGSEQLASANMRAAKAEARADRAEQAKAAERASLRAEHDRLMAVVEARLAEADGRADRAERAIVAERNVLRADHERVMAVAATRVAEAADRADRAEQALAGERSRGENLRDRLEAAERATEAVTAEAEQASREAEERDARTVQEATEALRQAETARQARGLLARLRAAWRGR